MGKNTIRIEFECNNDSFSGDDIAAAIQGVLGTIKDNFNDMTRADLAGMGNLKVHDEDGNSIGTLDVDIGEDYSEAEDYISRMPRQYVVELLEGHCSVQCYDSEDVGELRETLFQCLKDGDVDLDTVRAQCGD